MIDVERKFADGHLLAIGQPAVGFKDTAVDAVGATVILEPTRGFGAACWAGLQGATAAVVCFMDCDASLDPAALPEVAGYVLRGEAELAIGSRVADRGAWPIHARIANRALTAEVRRRTGLDVGDLGPMRAANREQLLALDLRDRRFGWPLEMVLLAQRAGWRIRSVPVPYHKRAGRSKVTGTVRGTIRAVSDMNRLLRDDSRQ